jgi:catalase (peroxidase I)
LAPAAFGEGTQPIMMLTSDISLLHDGNYTRLVEDWATKPALFEHAFAHSWYKLVTRDMGPITRCVGDKIPAAQPFQYPLPAPLPLEDLADMQAVREQLEMALTQDAKVTPDQGKSGAYYGAMFADLAYKCASTFRLSDYQGGCDGARVRFDPELGRAENKGLDQVLAVLTPIKDQFGDGLSWADLIGTQHIHAIIQTMTTATTTAITHTLSSVLAGQVALENAGALPMDFCAGRTDASDGVGSEFVAARFVGTPISKIT